MATEKKSATPVKVSKAAAEKALAWYVVDKSGLPRGQVIKLLEQNKIDPKMIDKISAALVPYGCTSS
ncbi:hypothetical protein ACFWZ4_13035 [Frateuria sp. GZRe12]|uniref:hypothetical protein n=1 Tax=Frateuria sp. GZRe12 TaxID=3351533 RepID=UPI003EDB9ECC